MTDTAPSAFDRVDALFQPQDEGWKAHPEYYLFEGYDVGPRPDWVYERAIADGVDLRADYLRTHVGDAPHGFQNAFLLSQARLRVLMAGNQVGKSLLVFMEIQMRMSGEIPFAYRYPAGHDTGIPRQITSANILRFGRRSLDTGAILDRNVNAARDGSWDCGTVRGAGVFPAEKIIVPGGTIRLGAPQKIIQANWWPSFTGRGKDSLGKFFLPTIMDTRRSRSSFGGANRQELQAFFQGERTLQFLSYETGGGKFESIEVPTYLDEEPQQKGMLSNVVMHAKDWTLAETPIYGITWTRKVAFPEKRRESHAVFHATAYDCPYKDPAKIEAQREELAEERWKIGAVMWGIPVEQDGKPYYNRDKINLWIQRFMPAGVQNYDLVNFIPKRDWDRIKTDRNRSRLEGLLDVPIEKMPAKEEDQRTVWRLYEDRKDSVGYVSASDQADGAELVEDVGDWNVAIIGRQKDPLVAPTSPIVCAVLRSSLPTAAFAREVLYAARYFNNALLAAESSKGAANATFKMVCDEWPFWFVDVVEMWSTRKARQERGFCPTTDRRETMFDVLLREHFEKFDDETYPEIPDERILREAAGAIVGWNRGKTATRCDHSEKGTLDVLVTYGILHFVMQEHFVSQIRCRGTAIGTTPRKSLLDQAVEAMQAQRDSQESRDLGSRVNTLR